MGKKAASASKYEMSAHTCTRCYNCSLHKEVFIHAPVSPAVMVSARAVVVRGSCRPQSRFAQETNKKIPFGNLGALGVPPGSSSSSSMGGFTDLLPAHFERNLEPNLTASDRKTKGWVLRLKIRGRFFHVTEEVVSGGGGGGGGGGFCSARGGGGERPTGGVKT